LINLLHTLTVASEACVCAFCDQNRGNVELLVELHVANEGIRVETNWTKVVSKFHTIEIFIRKTQIEKIPICLVGCVKDRRLGAVLHRILGNVCDILVLTFVPVVLVSNRSDVDVSWVIENVVVLV
jgi:hypothetical protein